MGDAYCNGNNDCKLIYNLYNNINQNLADQNDRLEAQIKNNGEVYSTDYQKSNYQNANVQYYKYINNILFWVYYLLVFAAAIVAVRSNLSRAYKALAIGAFVIYPLVIHNIEFLLYGLLQYMYAIVKGEPLGGT
jgi:hypothetical protein